MPDDKNKQQLLVNLFVVFVILLSVLYCGKKSAVYVDDVFITLKYARNLAENQGMVFNAGEKVWGTTSPLWCWINAAGFMLFPPDVYNTKACHYIYLITLFGAAFSMYRLIKRSGYSVFGFLGGIGFILLNDQIYLFGFEIALAIWLACEIVLALYSKRHYTIGALSALLILTRPESGLLFALILFLILLDLKSYKNVLKALLTFSLILIPALAILFIYYGDILPNTFHAKQAQLKQLYWSVKMLSGVKKYFLVNFIRENFLPPFLFFIGLFTLIYSFGKYLADHKNNREALIIFIIPAWAISHVIVLSIMKIPFYQWYLYPIWLMIYVLISSGIFSLYNFCNSNTLSTNNEIPGKVIFPAIIVMLIITWQTNWAGSNPGQMQKDRYEAYEKIAKTVNSISGKSESKTVSSEIGALGFYLSPNNKVIDEMGLVMKFPQSKIPDRGELVKIYEPEFIVETHPQFNYESLTDAEKDFQNQRLQPDFVLKYVSSKNSEIIYRPVEKIKNSFGLQILYKKD